MVKVFRLVGITMILVVGLCMVSWAADEPNFRAMGVPAEISICESTDLLSRLQLTGEQQKQLQTVLDDGKARFLTAKSEYEARPAAHATRPVRRASNKLHSSKLAEERNQWHRALCFVCARLRSMACSRRAERPV